MLNGLRFLGPLVLVMAPWIGYSLGGRHVIKVKGDSNGTWINLGEPAKVVEVRTSEDCAMLCNTYTWCRAAMLVQGPGEEGTTLEPEPSEDLTLFSQWIGDDGGTTLIQEEEEGSGPHMCRLYGNRFCRCPPDAIEIHPDLPSRYKVVENGYDARLPMEVAREDCHRQNMHVVAMETYEENQHIVEYLRNATQCRVAWTSGTSSNPQAENFMDWEWVINPALRKPVHYHTPWQTTFPRAILVETSPGNFTITDTIVIATTLDPPEKTWIDKIPYIRPSRLPNPPNMACYLCECEGD